MSIQTKAFKFDVKAVGDPARGEFVGYAAIHSTKDRNEEIIDVGAMTRTINASEGEFPLLWQHQREAPIGVVKLEETPSGAKAFGKVNLLTPLGQQAFSLMQPPEGFKRGALRDLSIGYITRKDKVEDGIRHLKEIQIFEVSLVTIAAHPKTYVTSVKTMDNEIDRIDRLEKAIRMIAATLSEEGLLMDPEHLHSMKSYLEDGPGDNADDPSIAHSLSELLSDMQLSQLRSGIHERDTRAQKGMGGDQESLPR